MLKRLLQEVKEFKKASLAAPLFMVGEVLLEISLPFFMSYIIDLGVNQGDLQANTVVSCVLRHSDPCFAERCRGNKRLMPLPVLPVIYAKPCFPMFKISHFAMWITSPLRAWLRA